LSVDTQYAYAVGRIRAIERKLFDKSKIDRMVDAKSAEEALRVLIEADYGYSAQEVSNVSGYEKLLSEEQKKLYKLLRDIAPQPEVFDVFLFKNDYHNIKVMLKAEFSGQEADHLLLDSGSIPLNKLKVMIKERNYKEMPDIMREAVNQCIDTFNRTGDPQAIDIILDGAAYEQMSRASNLSGNNYLKNIIMKTIDLENIKNFLRARRQDKPWDFVSKILLQGGILSKEFFYKSMEDSLDGFAESLKQTDYFSVCEEGVGRFKATGSLTRFEKLMDDFIMQVIKKAKYVSLGIEPLIGYLMAKETEIKNIRIIMVGKINNMSNEIIRERLREAYV